MGNILKTILLLCVLVASTTLLPAATYTVTNTNTSGAGSFHQAVLDANATTAADVITFASSLSGKTIVIEQGYTITYSLTVNGDLNNDGEPDVSLVSDGNAHRLFVSSEPAVTLSLNGLIVSNFTSSLIGGVIYQYFSDTGLFLSNCLFQNNHSNKYGGAITVTGQDAVIDNCSFINNASNQWGGAVLFNNDEYIDHTSTVSNCQFIGNDSRFSGGAIHNEGNIVVANSLFAENVGYRFASAVQSTYGTQKFLHCTVTNNTVETNNQGALWVYALDGNVSVENCLVVGNHRLSTNNNNLLNRTGVNNNLFTYYASGYSVDWSTTLVGTINGGADTNHFTDIAASDYTLAATSTAIDAGDPNLVGSYTTDLAGTSRVADAAPDLGVYEAGSTGFPPEGSSFVYVDQAATGANNGTSWADAYTNLETTLQAATAGDVVVVAAGTYSPASPSGFTLASGVYLFGGFSNAEVVDLARDDWATHTTTLNGAGAFHTVSVDSAADANTVLDGFTITGGNATGTDVNSRGGGVYTSWGAPTLRNLLVTGNQAVEGGGIFSVGSLALTLEEVQFLGNTAERGGGYYSMGDALTANSILGMNNTATGATNSFGGGVYISRSTASFTNATFTQNTALNGAGVFAGNATQNLDFTNVLVWANNNTVGTREFTVSTCPSTFIYCLFQVPRAFNDLGTAVTDLGANQVNIDPELAGDGYSLLTDSPAIRAGSYHHGSNIGYYQASGLGARVANNGAEANSEANRLTVSLFPNPTPGIVSVKGKGALSITVIGVQGRQVQQVSGHDLVSLNLTNQQAGLYLVKVIDAQGNTTTQRVIKR